MVYRRLHRLTILGMLLETFSMLGNEGSCTVRRLIMATGACPASSSYQNRSYSRYGTCTPQVIILVQKIIRSFPFSGSLRCSQLPDHCAVQTKVLT